MFSCSVPSPKKRRNRQHICIFFNHHTNKRIHFEVLIIDITGIMCRGLCFYSVPCSLVQSQNIAFSKTDVNIFIILFSCFITMEKQPVMCILISLPSSQYGTMIVNMAYVLQFSSQPVTEKTSFSIQAIIFHHKFKKLPFGFWF